MYLSRGVTVAACVSTLLLSAAACGNDADNSGSQSPRLVRLYGTDGNMSNSFGEAFKDQPGILAGMKGTALITQLSASFRNRLHEVDPTLKDYAYSAHAYDAVVIISIATELAGTTNPGEVAKYINGVTTGGKECDIVEQCLQLARAGDDLAYRGVSMRRGGFTDAGEPSTATYATLYFDENDKLDDGKTEYVGAGDPATTTTATPPKPQPARKKSEINAPLKLGGLLPKTGDLSLMYQPIVDGVQLALKEINAAGGVLGKPVKWIDGDDGTDPKVAMATVQSHLDAGVHAIIGAAASGITRAVLPAVVGAGRILFSPSNTAADLSEVDDKGLYFRTAPSDLLQGKALADIIMRDAAERVVIVARADAYGEGLQQNVNDSLRRAGMPGSQIKLISYQPQEGDGPKPGLSPITKLVKSFEPDAVLIIGYGESADVIKALIDEGVQIQH